MLITYRPYHCLERFCLLVWLCSSSCFFIAATETDLSRTHDEGNKTQTCPNQRPRHRWRSHSMADSTPIGNEAAGENSFITDTGGSTRPTAKRGRAPFESARPGRQRPARRPVARIVETSQRSGVAAQANER